MFNKKSNFTKKNAARLIPYQKKVNKKSVMYNKWVSKTM